MSAVTSFDRCRNDTRDYPRRIQQDIANTLGRPSGPIRDRGLLGVDRIVNHSAGVLMDHGNRRHGA